MQHTHIDTNTSTHIAQAQKLASVLTTAGRTVALAGVVLPLFLIGILKFTAVEIEVLKPLISGTPWLAWLYPVFGEAGASYLLGVVEVIAALLLIASPWSARAAVVGGAIASAIFITTISIMLALPVWEVASGGFPWLDALGSFLIKDVAMLGVSLAVFAEGLTKLVNNGRQ
ncbi:MAG: YkgB family protein [Gammaproteobacteria bacterium]|nr:YkgB family protein [Gammaproteobacteria bacterium]